VLPKEGNADCVCAMEDGLEVYTRPYEARRPVVCLDEASTQLVADVTPPLPMQPGPPARQDDAYERCGTATLCMRCAPLAGQRHVKVTAQRTNADVAVVLREVADVTYADADKMVLVRDNVHTHTLAVLSQVYPPEEARRLDARFEVHHTPQHASWLNMAETERSVLGRPCLDRRIAHQELLRREVAAWESTRNRAQVRVDWQFTTAAARIKLKRLYPKLEPGN
jgi:DDE superfamily endonuclease